MFQSAKIISSEHTNVLDYLGKVWKYKSLVLVFALQELKAQYTQTVLGVLWAVLRPLMVLLIFTFIFDKLIHIPGLQTPYALFVFSGLMAWNYFSFLVNNGGGAIAANQQLIQKVYFPKIILIFSKTVVGSVEFAISVVLMVLLMIIMQYPVSPNIIWLPVFILMNVVSGIAIALFLSALSVRFRDINHFVPQLIGFVIWLTPVFYPGTIMPPSYSFIISANPLAGIVQGYRFAILGESFVWSQHIVSFVVTILLMIIGFFIFIRVEDEMSDYL